ncbi:MAG TPA: hypothetical protein VMT81_02075 [Candidatus Paceibacterota bacterium]|nr:hypothetical protein [Candidatus Paceibacterota bacterium]
MDDASPETKPMFADPVMVEGIGTLTVAIVAPVGMAFSVESAMAHISVSIVGAVFMVHATGFPLVAVTVAFDAQVGTVTLNRIVPTFSVLLVIDNGICAVVPRSAEVGVMAAAADPETGAGIAAITSFENPLTLSLVSVAVAS